MDTSYEIVCATARKAPRRAYLEFDLHPEINTTQTFIEDTHKKYNEPNVINIVVDAWGQIPHNINVKNNPMSGAIQNILIFDNDGVDRSFINNFIASAKGCGIPVILTLFGPFRS